MSKSIRVVVVDDNDAVINGIKKYFESSEKVNVVNCFNNGKEALEYLTSNTDSYDLIITDVILKQTDGLLILEKLKQKKISKKVIILSSFKDDYAIRKSQDLGANYYMLKPVEMDALEKRIIDLSKSSNEESLETENVKLKVSSLLHDLGIPSHVRGYKYIREGVLILYDNESFTTLVTKEVYPKIADTFETTPTRVERAIRHAIEISWSRGDMKLMEKIFGNSVDYERGRPTNAEFLTAVADHFKISPVRIVS